MQQALERIGRRRRAPLLVVIAVAWLCTGASTLPERGSQADQDACTPDVFRLCSGFIPDEAKILACLEGKREQLSPECGKVLTPTPDPKRHKRTRKAPT